MTEKQFFKLNFFRIIGILISLAVITIIIDPYFHYHKPFSFYVLQTWKSKIHK